eukprot:Gb_33916 [translate_table: standard]
MMTRTSGHVHGNMGSNCGCFHSLICFRSLSPIHIFHEFCSCTTSAPSEIVWPCSKLIWNSAPFEETGRLSMNLHHGLKACVHGEIQVEQRFYKEDK